MSHSKSDGTRRTAKAHRKTWLRLCVRTVAAAFLFLASMSQLLATEDMHFDGSGRESPWDNCATCHGNELSGNIIGPSCMACHDAFSKPGLPAVGHHVEGREAPLENCASCHGNTLMGSGAASSCFSCHDSLWPGSELSPVADASGPYTGYVDIAMSLNGSNSIDLDGTIQSYEWDFGDGDTGTGGNPTHTYTADGLYTVTVTVTDDGGLTDTTTTTADITTTTNTPPVADPGGPYTGGVSSPLLIDGSGSSDAGGTIASYDWNFGDGTTGTGPLLMHAYSAAGPYTVTLTVTDNVGFTDTATTTVVISDSGNLPPIVDAGGPYSGAPGQEIQFDASGSVDPEGATLSAVWAFEGDPQPVFGLTATHAWSQPGTYTATLTVIDGANLPVVVDVQVEISNDSQEPPNPQGNSWFVTVPFGYWYEEFIVTFVESNGFLWVDTFYPDGQYALGMGVQSDDFVYWMDGSGNIFFGKIDAGTMKGIMWSNWNTTIWFAEPLP